jgi:methionyl-tRNA formyltransferase
MRTAVICNSDTLAMPAIHQLLQQNKLAGIGILHRNRHALLPQLLNVGVSKADILLLRKEGWELQLNDWLKAINADLVLVFGFPWVIPDTILTIPQHGFLNFHFGDLPKYKGADPIFWQLMNNEPNSTLTVHRMTREVDEGPIVLRHTTPLIKGENYGLLCQRLGFAAAELITPLFEAINNRVLFEPVSGESSDDFLKKPANNTLVIQWREQSAEQIECLVNASNPRYGGASTYLRNAEIRILETSPAEIKLQENYSPEPGTIVYADALYGLIVACKDNQFLKINITQFREGYFSGTKLFNMGIKPGEKFSSN